MCLCTYGCWCECVCVCEGVSVGVYMCAGVWICILSPQSKDIHFLERVYHVMINPYLLRRKAY